MQAGCILFTTRFRKQNATGAQNSWSHCVQTIDSETIYPETAELIGNAASMTEKASAQAQDLTDVGNVSVLAEVGDLGLQDGRNFGGANVHGFYALLRANLRESSFDLSEAS